MALIAVIIPYYQRQAGLLQRAVRSVIDQEVATDHRIAIVVVDDSSPHPAASDLEGIDTAAGVSIEIVRKPNGGPGSARNVGIVKSLEKGADYAAFLDSDDWWSPQHIGKAVATLSASGGRFYCSNSMHDDVTSFSYFKANQVLVEEEDPATRTGVIPTGRAFDLLLSECVTHTSQVVYDLPHHAELRFDERLQRTGEDHLFWLSIVEARSALHYSTEVMGYRGRGVSVYRASLDRSSLSYFDRLLQAAHFRELVPKMIGLDAPQSRINAEHRKAAFDEISFAIARFALRDPVMLAAALKRLAAERQQGLYRGIMSSFLRLQKTRRRLNEAQP